MDGMKFVFQFVILLSLADFKYSAAKRYNVHILNIDCNPNCNFWTYQFSVLNRTHFSGYIHLVQSLPKLLFHIEFTRVESTHRKNVIYEKKFVSCQSRRSTNFDAIYLQFLVGQFTGGLGLKCPIEQQNISIAAATVYSPNIPWGLFYLPNSHFVVNTTITVVKNGKQYFAGFLVTKSQIVKI